MGVPQREWFTQHTGACLVETDHDHIVGHRAQYMAAQQLELGIDEQQLQRLQPGQPVQRRGQQHGENGTAGAYHGSKSSA